MRSFCALKYIVLLLWGVSLSGQPIEEVPFELADNIIFIQVNINGSRHLNFMFDSGAGITVLNKSVTAELDLSYNGGSQIGTSGKTIRSETSPENTLSIGKVTLNKVPLEIIGLDHLSSYFKIPVDGIIGYDLFEKYILKIDADHKTMAFYDSIVSLATVAWKEVVAHKVDNNKIGVETFLLTPEGAFEGYIMALDTASPDEIHLFPNALADRRIALKQGRKKVKGFSADTTITENLRGKIKGVKLAGKEWRNVRTVIPTDPVSVKAFSDNQSFGLIGQELLLEFNMIYDYRNNRVYFQERKSGH
jgi:hypothetical protein